VPIEGASRPAGAAAGVRRRVRYRVAGAALVGRVPSNCQSVVSISADLRDINEVLSSADQSSSAAPRRRSPICSTAASWSTRASSSSPTGAPTADAGPERGLGVGLRERGPGAAVTGQPR
jgi:hypothetical protein